MDDPTNTLADRLRENQLVRLRELEAQKLILDDQPKSEERSIRMKKLRREIRKLKDQLGLRVHDEPEQPADPDQSPTAVGLAKKVRSQKDRPHPLDGEWYLDIDRDYRSNPNGFAIWIQELSMDLMGLGIEPRTPPAEPWPPIHVFILGTEYDRKTKAEMFMRKFRARWMDHPAEWFFITQLHGNQVVAFGPLPPGMVQDP